MADEQTPLTLIVRVNKETGQLEVVKAELKDVQNQLKDFHGSATSLTGAFQSLQGAMAGLISATAIEEFFRQAISVASEEQQAIAHLQAQLQASGISWDQNKESIEAWAQKLADATRFQIADTIPALGVAIQRTHDLEQAQKVVQLAMDISVATGKDFSEMLNVLSIAAGGSSRGVMMLERDFGALIPQTSTASQALEILAQHFAGNAEKSNLLTDSTSKFSGAVKQAAVDVGTDMLPTLQRWLGWFGEVIPWIERFIVTWQTLFSTVGSIIVGITGILYTFVTTEVKVFVDILTGHWKQVASDIEVTITSVKAAVSAALDDVAKTITDGSDRMDAISQRSVEAQKGHIQELSDFKAAAGKKDLIEAAKIADEELALIAKHLQAELALKNQTIAQKDALIVAAAAKERAIVQQEVEQGALTETVGQEKIKKIDEASFDERTRLHQKYITDITGEVEKWVATNMDVDAQLVKAGISAFDSLDKSFGVAFAKMARGGHDFTKDMSAAFGALEDQILAAIAEIIAKWLVLEVLTGGGAGPLGKFFVSHFAEGGRVTGPTIAEIGEGGEPETVVPDSKAKDFALGVLASQSSPGSTPLSGSGSSPGGGGGGTVIVNNHITINYAGGAGGGSMSRSDSDQMLSALADQVAMKTEAAVRFAVRVVDTGNKKSGLSV